MNENSLSGSSSIVFKEQRARYALPPDLEEFLRHGKRFNTVHGPFLVGPMSNVRLVSVLVNHHNMLSHGDGFAILGNPYANEDGLFCINALALVDSSPECSDPDEILLWIPELNLYGWWDSDNLELFVFPNKTWRDIEKRPSFFLLSRWGYNRFTNILCHERIWDHFDFIPQDLESQIERVKMLDDPDKEVEFLRECERCLGTHPFSILLVDQYQALLGFYEYLTEKRHAIATSHSKYKTWLDVCQRKFELDD